MMSQDLRYGAGTDDARTRLQDEKVFSELQRALHDIGPLLMFHTEQTPERYDVTTTTRLTLTDPPLHTGAPMQLP